MRDSDPNPPRILVIEDDPTNQYVFRTILAGAGYSVEIASDGRAGIERALADPPRLILLDMMMPVLDGYEAATILSSNPVLDGVPIIALTANAMRGDRDRCLESGCDDYLSKPVARKALLQLLARWLHARETDWMPSRKARRRRMA